MTFPTAIGVTMTHSVAEILWHSSLVLFMGVDQSIVFTLFIRLRFQHFIHSSCSSHPLFVTFHSGTWGDSVDVRVTFLFFLFFIFFYFSFYFLPFFFFFFFRLCLSVMSVSDKRMASDLCESLSSTFDQFQKLSLDVFIVLKILSIFFFFFILSVCQG